MSFFFPLPHPGTTAPPTVPVQLTDSNPAFSPLLACPGLQRQYFLNARSSLFGSDGETADSFILTVSVSGNVHLDHAISPIGPPRESSSHSFFYWLFPPTPSFFPPIPDTTLAEIVQLCPPHSPFLEFYIHFPLSARMSRFSQPPSSSFIPPPHSSVSPNLGRFLFGCTRAQVPPSGIDIGTCKSGMVHSFSPAFLS